MLLPLQLLEHLGDVVEGETGAKAKGSGQNSKRPVRLLVLPDGETKTQRLVDDLLEALPRGARALTQLGRHVVVHGQRRSHIKMITIDHHGSPAWHYRWYRNGMRTTIDKAGRVVIPKVLRDMVGLEGEVEISCEGGGIRLEPVPGEGLVEEGGRLVIPPGGARMDDDAVRELRLGDQR